MIVKLLQRPLAFFLVSMLTFVCAAGLYRHQAHLKSHSHHWYDRRLLLLDGAVLASWNFASWNFAS